MISPSGKVFREKPRNFHVERSIRLFGVLVMVEGENGGGGGGFSKKQRYGIADKLNNQG